MSKTITVTKSAHSDPQLKSLLREALDRHHDYLNDQRRHFGDALEFLLQNDTRHPDIPMLSAKADKYAKQYEDMYELLIALDFGDITITYDDLAPF